MCSQEVRFNLISNFALVLLVGEIVNIVFPDQCLGWVFGWC